MSHSPVLSHPHMGDYAVVIRQLLGHLFPQARILTPPPITQKTVELGGQHSPDFVCAPFKYNLGNYIEALQQGANVLFQTGTGCRYGYYGELQQQILTDLGYKFQFVCLSRERAQPLKALRLLRQVGCTLPLRRILHAFLLAAHSLYVMDRYEYWMREHIGFQREKGACEGMWKALLEDIAAAHTHRQLMAARQRCKQAAKKIAFDLPEHPLRVGIVGELFTLMEPFTTFDLEGQLAKEGIVVSRVMSVWFLLFGRSSNRMLRRCGGYLRYKVGANGLDSVFQSLRYARRGYDGILHLKSFGCIPELNVTPALMQLSQREGIPVLELSFDLQTSQAGVQTRLEAFADMVRMRRQAEQKNKPGDGSGPGKKGFALQ